MTPEKFINTATYDDSGQMIFGVQPNGHHQLILQLRGWGAIQNLFKDQDEAARFQDEVGHFVANAINEKINPIPIGDKTDEWSDKKPDSEGLWLAMDKADKNSIPFVRDVRLHDGELKVEIPTGGGMTTIKVINLNDNYKYFKIPPTNI